MVQLIWLQGYLVEGADKSDTQAGALTPCIDIFYSVASSLKKQETMGRQMCPWFPQKPLLLSSAWSLLMGRGHLDQDLLSAKPDEAMTDLFLPKRVLDTSST